MTEQLQKDAERNEQVYEGKLTQMEADEQAEEWQTVRTPTQKRKKRYDSTLTRSLFLASDIVGIVRLFRPSRLCRCRPFVQQGYLTP
jgi:hypothetical protein